VQPDPRRGGGIQRLILKRVISLGMVATIAFLLLVSLVVSAAVSAFGDVLGGRLGGLSGVVVQAIQLGLSLTVIAALFAIIFKALPDARVSWRDALTGAVFTTLLFGAGKYLIGFYLSESNPGSIFGGAAALAVIMVWIYYSAMIVFLGAEFTQAWAVGHGREIEPSKGAVRAQPRTDLLPKPQPPGRRTRTSPAGGADGAPYP
jgi:membrane protein